MEQTELADLQKRLGFHPDHRKAISRDPFLLEYVNLKLAAMGCPTTGSREDFPFMNLAEPLLADYKEKSRLLARHYCPADERIHHFIDNFLAGTPLDEPPRLPSSTFVLDRHGLARMLSLPAHGDSFQSDIVTSYRCANGVLHNPKHDRRTTKGVFHVVEGGLAIPADKTAVPKVVFANMLAAAMNPPAELLRLPFTAAQENKAECWVSLLLRPVVSPEVPGFIEQKSLEVRFFAPGNCVCNLDFVESIFGNGGDPYLIGNDASLDPNHWTGHTGCVILAPHILGLPKKQLGLPHTSQASEQQKATGMCWENPDEPYNDGGAFKLTARDSSGVIVTLIADNYFGYCKKEIKTQISFSANLYGMVEEEHAGGAIAFANYDLGEEFCLTDLYSDIPDWDSFVQAEGELFHLRPEGYGVDRKYPDISYIPGHAQFSLQDQRITWTHNQQERSTRLRPGISYVLPNGYRVEMVRPHAGRRWRLIGTASEGTFCHKPCTVSGGGKSEISKSIADAILTGPVFVADFKRDFDLVEQIIERDYSGRFADPALHGSDKRPLLSPQRSLGSVVKLLTPSSEYSQEYNEWLQSLPFYVKELVFVVKRFFKPDWEDHWRDRFRVDIVNGVGGNELRYRDQKLMTQYARVGFTSEGQWRTYVLRKDFFPATKLQTEDDITASVVVPANQTKGLQTAYKNPSHKFAFNCENRLFQRPDEAIHRGYDSKAEADMSAKGNFFSNYQPQNREAIKDLVEDTIRFDQWTQPVKNLLTSFLDDDSPEFCVSPAHPRIVDGKPSKNPRYLQDVDLLTDPRRFYLGELATRISRGIAPGKPVPMPVNAILPGRRNNPPEPGIRPLAVYGPIHYMPLPELLIEFTASMTGKSPSTTGAGSEGALTKAPFNALLPIVDLNTALVSYLATGHHGFVTAAGYVGPKYRVDHDISLLVPEVWCRMKAAERDPQWLIENGHLEPCQDFEHNGRQILASRLGYRITGKFVRHFFGRVFANPAALFPQEMLRPEEQDMEVFLDGMDNIVTTHQRVAQYYFQDGSIEHAVPPLRAILHIMAEGSYQGKTLQDPEIRSLFDRETMLESDWYQARLTERQRTEIALYQRHAEELKRFVKLSHWQDTDKLGEAFRKLEACEKRLAHIRSPEYLKQLVGTIGAEPCVKWEPYQIPDTAE